MCKSCPYHIALDKSQETPIIEIDFVIYHFSKINDIDGENEVVIVYIYGKILNQTKEH